MPDACRRARDRQQEYHSYVKHTQQARRDDDDGHAAADMHCWLWCFDSLPDHWGRGGQAQVAIGCLRRIVGDMAGRARTPSRKRASSPTKVSATPNQRQPRATSRLTHVFDRCIRNRIIRGRVSKNARDAVPRPESPPPLFNGSSNWYTCKKYL